MSVDTFDCSGIVPSRLDVRRDERYDGGGFGVFLEDLTSEDADAIRLVHDRTEALYRLWIDVR